MTIWILTFKRNFTNKGKNIANILAQSSYSSYILTMPQKFDAISQLIWILFSERQIIFLHFLFPSQNIWTLHEWIQNASKKNPKPET